MRRLYLFRLLAIGFGFGFGLLGRIARLLRRLLLYSRLFRTLLRRRRRLIMLDLSPFPQLPIRHCFERRPAVSHGPRHHLLDAHFAGVAVGFGVDVAGRVGCAPGRATERGRGVRRHGCGGHAGREGRLRDV